MKIAVIGAGVIGVSIAAEAAARGADVTLIDKNAPGSGTSLITYAWVNSNGKEPVGYYELNRAGLEAHHRLAGTGADWFRPTGHIELAARLACGSSISDYRAGSGRHAGRLPGARACFKFLVPLARGNGVFAVSCLGDVDAGVTPAMA
jgi:glycine/D-amino acid oxidase-like deaminating enzyme